MIELHIHRRATASDADRHTPRPRGAAFRPFQPAMPSLDLPPEQEPAYAEEAAAWAQGPGRSLVAVGDAEGVLWETPSERVIERRYRMPALAPQAGLPDSVRPDTSTLIRATLDAGGRPLAWWQRVIEDATASPESCPLPYDIPHRTLHAVDAPGAAPAPQGYDTECFVDELAHAAGRDPYAYRRELLPAGSRHRRVLETAALRAGWGTALPRGHGRGIALVESSGSVAAQVIEVSVDNEGRPRVHRVVAVVDGGGCVPETAAQHQVQSAVLATLTELGATLAPQAAPVIEVHVIPSEAPAGTLIEPSVPPVAPALCNALFAATGQRVRQLPVLQPLVSAAAAR